MKIKDLTDHLESIAPLNLQESYDNAGLIVGNSDWECTGALVCLDSIEEVINEAIKLNCNLVIAHHPIVFRGLKKITGKNYIERTIIKAIKNEIAIYAIHTNLDNVLTKGVNGKIAEILNLKEISVLNPKDPTNNKIGSGVIGQLDQSYTPMEFMSLLKTKMDTKLIRHTAICKEKIKTVAVCGGSGSFLLKYAMKENADIFITGDFKYHDFFDADNKIIIADIGHFESEQFTQDLLIQIITKKFSKFAVFKTSTYTNPLNYF